MPASHLVYFADPMCSWCYGFAPQLDGLLQQRPGLRVDLVMGGLRAYHTEKATPQFRATIAGHWQQVAAASGLPFNDAALAREGFVYDTEPACRAVVAVRTMDPALALAYMKAVQRAFYAQGRDVTDADVLAEVAAEQGIDRAAFVSAHASGQAREAVRQDFATVQQMGVGGFPTLAAGYADQPLVLVTAGFAKAADLQERLDRIDALARDN